MIEIVMYTAPSFDTMTTPGARKLAVMSLHFMDGVLGFMSLRTPYERALLLAPGTENDAIVFDDDGMEPVIPQVVGPIGDLEKTIDRIFSAGVKGVRVIPARFDVLCIPRLNRCEVRQPSDDPEYEPDIPLGPGMAATLFYTTEDEAIQYALAGAEPSYIVLTVAATRDGDVVGFGLSMASLQIVAAARDRYSFLTASGGLGLCAVADDQRLVDRFVEELSRLGEGKDMVFLGALVFEDSKILADKVLGGGCQACQIPLPADDKLSRIFQ